MTPFPTDNAHAQNVPLTKLLPPTPSLPPFSQSTTLNPLPLCSLSSELSWFQNSLLPTTKSSAPTTNTYLLYFQYTRLPR
jgi:hypothetical protein